jgi:hypothetical protein
MLRISKICTLLCLATSVLMSGCSNASTLSIPIASPYLTSPVIEEWFGMRISPDLWQAETVENTIYEHGLLTHRQLAGCRARILSETPPSIGNYDPDWDTSSSRNFSTDTLGLELWRMQDKNGHLRDIYFEVYDITGADPNSGKHLLRRLAYVLVETGDNSIQCVDAVYAVLSSINPKAFPDIGIAQG